MLGYCSSPVVLYLVCAMVVNWLTGNDTGYDGTFCMQSRNLSHGPSKPAFLLSDLCALRDDVTAVPLPGLATLYSGFMRTKSATCSHFAQNDVHFSVLILYSVQQQISFDQLMLVEQRNAVKY